MKRIIGLFILAGAWEALVTVAHSPMLVSLPRVAVAFWTMTASGEMATDILTSLQEITLGFALAGGFGLVAAVCIYQNKTVDEILTPMIDTVRNIPALMLMPAIVLLFGIGVLPKVIIVFLNAYPPCLLASLQAIREADPAAKEAAMLDGAGRFTLMTRIVIPIALPSIMTGFRAGMGAAWLSVIGAELLGSQAGLGSAVVNYSNVFSFPEVYASIVATALVGLAINTALLRLQNLLDYTKE